MLTSRLIIILYGIRYKMQSKSEKIKHGIQDKRREKCSHNSKIYALCQKLFFLIIAYNFFEDKQ